MKNSNFSIIHCASVQTFLLVARRKIKPVLFPCSDELNAIPDSSYLDEVQDKNLKYLIFKGCILWIFAQN